MSIASDAFMVVSFAVAALAVLALLARRVGRAAIEWLARRRRTRAQSASQSSPMLINSLVHVAERIEAIAIARSRDRLCDRVQYLASPAYADNELHAEILGDRARMLAQPFVREGFGAYAENLEQVEPGTVLTLILRTHRKQRIVAWCVAVDPVAWTCDSARVGDLELLGNMGVPLALAVDSLRGQVCGPDLNAQLVIRARGRALVPLVAVAGRVSK